MSRSSEGAPALDVLVPTYRRPAALAVTLTRAQTLPRFRVVVLPVVEQRAG